MPDDANIGFGNSKTPGRFRPHPIVIERHHDDGAFALGEGLNAAGQLTVVDPRQRRRLRHQIVAERCQQLLLTPCAASQIEHRHAARAQHELNEFV